MNRVRPDVSQPLPADPRRIVHVETASGARPDARARVVWLVGELDDSSVEGVLVDLLQLCDADLCGSVVLDLSRMTFVDAAGLRTLFVLQRCLAPQEQTLTLRAVPTHVLLVLLATGCLGVFSVDGVTYPVDGPA